MSETLDTKLFDNELKKCPFCGDEPKFYTTNLKVSGNTVYIHYIFGCENCSVYAPHPKNRTRYESCVSLNLDKYGRIHVGLDDRKEDIESWNCRVK